MSLYEQLLTALATNKLALRLIDQRTKERDEWRECAEKAVALLRGPEDAA